MDYGVSGQNPPPFHAGHDLPPPHTLKFSIVIIFPILEPRLFKIAYRHAVPY